MMKALARVVATLLDRRGGWPGAYELLELPYMLSPWTRDARVRADVVTIAPDVAGFVTDLRVGDDPAVHKGDILFVVDQERYKLAVASAEANLAARHAEMLMRQTTPIEQSSRTSPFLTKTRRTPSMWRRRRSPPTSRLRPDLSTAKLNLERTVIRAPSMNSSRTSAWSSGNTLPSGPSCWR